jgi:hypothetical protein
MTSLQRFQRRFRFPIRRSGAPVGLACPSGPAGSARPKPGSRNVVWTIRPEHPARRGSGSFGLPRDLHGRSPVARLASEAPRAARRRLPDVRALLDFAPPSEPLLRADRAATRERAVPDLPLLGFVFAPLHRHASAASTPAGVATGFGPRSPDLGHVPPSWFCTTSTVSSATEGAGLLHPAASHGVRRVSRIRGRHRPEPMTVDGKRSPRRGSYPSKNPPRRQPYRVTTALAFLPLPDRRPTGAPVHRSGPPHRTFDVPVASLRRGRRHRRAGSKALLHRRVRSVPPTFPSADALSFHGLRSPPRSIRTRSPRGARLRTGTGPLARTGTESLPRFAPDTRRCAGTPRESVRSGVGESDTGATTEGLATAGGHRGVHRRPSWGF